MIDTKLLRQKILDLAIRGKLVPQNPADEPASELLKKIKAEKEALVKAGKIKKGKLESFIFRGDDKRYYEQIDGRTTDITEEIPFELPQGWAWVRLKQLFSVVSARRVHKADWKVVGIPFYRAREVAKLSETGFVNNDLFISEDQYISYKQSSGVPLPGDLMVTAVGTIGKVYVVKKDDIFYYKDASVICFENRYHINPYFYKNLFFTSFMISQVHKNSTGSTVDTITIEKAEQYLLPLPPLSEQKHIVSQIESLLKCVDEIDRESETLEKSISLAKQKVLDLAIRGKLVPQNPEDEPASELLKRIKAEKEALVKAGKIKKNKHESFIFKGDDNCYHENIDGKTLNIAKGISFELPQTWVWCRLSSVLLPTGSKKPQGDFFDYIDIDAINNLCQEIIYAKHLRVKGAPSRASREIREGDTLFSLVRPYLKNIVFVSGKYADCIASTGFYVCRPASGIDNRYLFWLMISDYTVNGINSHTKGDNSPSVRKEDIDNFMVPIPPLTEQKRIVAQVERLLSVLETMRG